MFNLCLTYVYRYHNSFLTTKTCKKCLKIAKKAKKIWSCQKKAVILQSVLSLWRLN